MEQLKVNDQKSCRNHIKVYKNCTKEKQKSQLTKMIKKQKRDKWKYINIEMKRCQYRQKLQIQTKYMHAMIVEKKYTITNNNQEKQEELISYTIR